MSEPCTAGAPMPVIRLMDGLDAMLPFLREFFGNHGLAIDLLPLEAEIPGSYWGPPEAGLIRHTLHVRPDTPLTSLLHEACHYLCMEMARRVLLDTDAGGDVLEECAVCYLSVLVADLVPGYSRARMLSDMDAWGYSFRLGSAAAWFEHDAEDARTWLVKQGWLPARILRAA
jgi:hypothetical protein